MSSMGKDNVQMCSHVLRLVELPPGPDGVPMAEIPGYSFEFVDELPVPVQHLDLYKFIVSRYGPLISGPIDSLPLAPAAITLILDVIAELSYFGKESKVPTRELLDEYVMKADCAAICGLSVHWLQKMLQDLNGSSDIAARASAARMAVFKANACFLIAQNNALLADEAALEEIEPVEDANQAEKRAIQQFIKNWWITL